MVATAALCFTVDGDARTFGHCTVATRIASGVGVMSQVQGEESNWSRIQMERGMKSDGLPTKHQLAAGAGERGSGAVAGCGRSGRQASPAAERRLWAEQPRAVAVVVVGSPPSSSPWARLHGAAIRRHRPGVAVAVHRWVEVPADDAPQSLALLLCRGSDSGGGGSVAGLIPWSSRTLSSRSCSRSMSTLSVSSASWTVVGVGAVSLAVFADFAVALDVVAHTHIRWRRSADAGGAAEGERGGRAAAGERGGGQSSGRRARRSGRQWMGRGAPPCSAATTAVPPRVPDDARRGITGGRRGRGRGRDCLLVAGRLPLPPKLAGLRSATALALRYTVRGLLALHCSARRRARTFRCFVATLALRYAA
uniref:OSJNBb0059K02.6 protein n=1 Tax=Oryza sativa subsp. japonica TaxID=39947 RepID=Q7XMQ5_ORYSJ|nr:OSJNBb0059K02.6 [Oryza sativa Japonica Group]